MRTYALWACLTGALLTSCIVEAPSGEKSGDRARAAASAQPAAVKLGANLDDKLELLGAQLFPGQLTSVTPTRVVLIFRVLAAIPVDYNLFVHLEDAVSGAQLANLDHAPSGGVPTSQWVPGRVYQDEFQVIVPAENATNLAQLWVGLWDPKTDTRMALKNASSVRNDGRNRILVGPIPVVRY